jgi:dihydroflavonol-4-reductase
VATPTITPATHGLTLVTGGSGYIAGYCIAQLLNEGWRVRTTVRNLGRAEEVRASIGKIAANAGAIEFAAADLNSDAGWANAVARADFVLHVASPVPAVDPKTDDELVRPARDGTLRVLKASRDAGVRRVVMTSSMAAIAYGRGERAEPFTEADWTDETNRNDTSAYERSKTIAERAAWAWQKAEGGTLELVTVNPALVLGPVLGSDFSASLDAIKKLLDGSVPALPRFGFSLVDVRDIAQLHLLAMTSAAGQRFLGSADFYWMKDMAKILKQGLGEKARKVPSIAIPEFLVRLFAVFDPVVRTQLFNLGKRRLVSSDKARRELGWTTRPVPETIVDNRQEPSSAGLGVDCALIGARVNLIDASRRSPKARTQTGRRAMGSLAAARLGAAQCPRSGSGARSTTKARSSICWSSDGAIKQP